MRRLRLATASCAVASSAVVALVTVASGSAAPPSGTLHLTSKTLVQTVPTGQPKPGDRFVFYDRESGGDRGHDYTVCVVTGPKGKTLCDTLFVLQHGDISVQGAGSFTPSAHFTGLILAGTGRYAGARGSAVVSGSAAVTRFTLRFGS